LNKKDQIQQEAIRKLAKISATRSGGFRVDPAAEQRERDRIARLVDPEYKPTPTDAKIQRPSSLSGILQILKFIVIIALIIYIGTGF